ncbi:MAG: hypothetical protein ACXV8X_07230, partial [Candidatus Angelobacter sp.]
KQHARVMREGVFAIVISKNPRNNFQKNPQQEQAEAANKEPRHPGSSVAFGDQREKQRDEPHEQS